MRKLLISSFLLLFALVVLPGFVAPTEAATAPTAASTPLVALTPDQARQALEVLNSPTRRAQIEDTLRAIAAAGALSAPAPTTATATAASGAAAASPAGASAVSALQTNGLASQLARQGARWSLHVITVLRSSLAALLDVSSLRAWWSDELTNPQHRAILGRVLGSLLAALLPALVLEWLARRLLRRASSALAARQRDALDLPASASAPNAPAPSSNTPAAANPIAPSREARGEEHVALHWSLLRRLPHAVLRLIVKALPLVVFVAAASATMSLLTDDGTPQDEAIGALIDIYVICRVVVIAAGFFTQPDAPGLRLLRLGDTWAAWLQRWIVRSVTLIGAGSAIVETAAALGLNDTAHVALTKAVALIGHVLLSLMILQCRQPVAAWIRAHTSGNRPTSLVGNGLADAWAAIAIFLVMALWFVWALDVENGYHALLHVGGITIAILVGARVASIVLLGALARFFHVEGDAQLSLVHQHAYRYYPLLRRTLSVLIVICTVFLLLLAWGVDLRQLFSSGSIGHRLASALVTIAVAAAIALFVWEAVNVAVERRLDQWTARGDIARAARLRTLLPMLRATLFVVIALVVVLTGLSQLGVNTAPLLAGASIFGVALGFGSQKLVQDFITGIFLLMENAMQVGDSVTVASVSGTVEYLSIRTVRLRASDGSLFTVPFSSVTTVNNTNRGLGNAAVKVSIAYGQDIDLAVATLKEIGTSLRNDDAFKAGILSDFSYWGIDQVDGAAMVLSGQVQCRDTARWGVQREFNRRIAEQFLARGIQIANPQRSVWVRDRSDGSEARDATAPQTGAPRAGS
ncbi:mechanosensitive ion channel family protein [Paraburkholderia megapolitana]|uniref:Small-conductance mechanosensitive channel n=1 Tax=Paraburkholderia megapolitana TaxID=420953 RepID=A0A1I3DR04_9BURK|nr:mechanosensitive ion channel domain-containing protein [Paraburkholderia megapolitana]QDQ79718.1 mechanosensitive ion channel [Paraburkholderia megapolitana]SFH88998.1 Small-conductance mechanosensitive channel [Paraburkholderia megapolitana]